MYAILDELTNPQLVNVGGDDDNEVDHLYCCDENVALCGTDISDCWEIGDEIYGSADKCVVCEDLIDAPCSICGE